MNQELYAVVEYLLNRASDADIEVIEEALKRRQNDRKASMAMNMDTQKMAKDMASSVSGQMGMSVDAIRNMIRGYVVKIIQKEAPDISDRDLKVLLQQWVPDPSEQQEETVSIPVDALQTMIQQFIAYSLDRIPPGHKLRLNQELPDWHTLYWQRFPPRIRGLISLFLKGKLDEAVFWEQVQLELGSS